MIASPSDVVEQRDDVRSIISNWNFVNGHARKLILMPVGWETHAAPDLGGRAQGLINDRLLSDCDLLVGVFWTKLGTPTGEFGSGTVEEISRHVDAGKPAMVYFSDAPVAPESLNPDQYSKVKSFKNWCFERGLIATFSNAAEFRVLFASQLQIQLNSNPYLQAILTNAGVSDAAVPAIELSEDGKSLLLSAAQDSSGYILAISTLGGKHLQVNGETFGDPGNARSAARWEAALEELLSLRYILARGNKGQVFQISDAGYKRADQLKEDLGV